jgi:hypothetical protein
MPFRSLITQEEDSQYSVTEPVVERPAKNQPKPFLRVLLGCIAIGVVYVLYIQPKWSDVSLTVHKE